MADGRPFLFVGTDEMKSLGIRNLILLVALVPAVLVATLVTAVLVAGQLRQAEAEQHRRLDAVARQLAALAEYPLFTNNTAALNELLKVARGEPDVLAAAFLDTHGAVLASTLPAARLPPVTAAIDGFASPQVMDDQPLHWHALAIRGTALAENDLYAATSAPPPPPLGHLLLQVSQQTLNAEMRRLAAQAVGIAVLVFMVGMLLAMLISRRLVRTLTEIGQVVAGIGA